MAKRIIDKTKTGVLKIELSNLLEGKYEHILADVLRLFRKENPTTITQVDSFLPKMGKILKEVSPSMQTKIELFVRKAYGRGAGFGANRLSKLTNQKVGISFTLGHQLALNNLRKMSFSNIKNINDDMANRVRRGLYASIQAGEGSKEAAKRIQGSFMKLPKEDRDEFQQNIKLTPEHRIKLIARDAIHDAFSEGSVQQYREFGVQKVMWRTGKERVCPICQPLDKTVKKLGETFVSTYKGKVFKAKRPKMHPRCRCLLLPVIQ